MRMLNRILKPLSRSASPYHNIYFVADPTPVDVDHTVYACLCILRP